MIRATLLGFALLATVCYGAENTRFSDSATPIIVSRNNPVFVINLQANPTTGYKWVLNRTDNVLLIPQKQRYIPEKKGLIGGGGCDEWSFRIAPQGFVVPHLLTLEFTYMRPWTLQGAKREVFTVLTID